MLERKERDWGGMRDAKALIEDSKIYNRNILEVVNCIHKSMCLRISGQVDE